MLILSHSRDLPPPPPQFDDPPPATGLEQFGRGRKCFKTFDSTLLSCTMFWQASTQPWQRWTQRATQATTHFEALHLATSPNPPSLSPHPPSTPPLSSHRLQRLIYSLTSPHQQAAASRPYPNSILQPGHYDIPWVHYDASPFSQVIDQVYCVCLHSFSFQHSQHPTLSTESIAESSYKTLTGSRGILGDFNHYVPSVAASPGFSLHHAEPSVPDQTTLPRFWKLVFSIHSQHFFSNGRYPPSSQESTSDPFSPATGSECLTCGAALSGARQWRSSNTTSSQLCDSCANYSKMNRPPGTTTSSGGGRGSPPSSRSKSGAAPPPTGNRRTGMNCANCRFEFRE